MSKTWDPDHLRLAAAVVTVRETLRRLAPTLPDDAGQTLARCATRLTLALKARTTKSRETAQ
jgi:hypothetical protein